MCAKTFSDFVVEKRNRIHLSNSRLAASANISAVYLGEIIKNKKNPPDRKIQYALAEALQLTNKERTEFFNLAARERGEIPVDVYDYLLKSNGLIEEIRARKDRENTCKRV